jgi:RNA polymerase sigma-70 factor (ECF subfamily)
MPPFSRGETVLSQSQINPFSASRTGAIRHSETLRQHCYNQRMTVAPGNSTPIPTVASEPDWQDVALRARLSGIAGRDEAELAALYDATAARLFTLALRIVGDRGDAEEVVSDVFVQVWEQAKRYDPARGKVMHWLYMICRSRALDHLRRRDDAETMAEPDTLRADAESGDLDPVQALMSIEQGSAIHNALQNLNAAQRQLIALAFFQDMSHSDIAEQTGIPLGTVKSTLRRSLLTLREIMQGNGNAEVSYGG